MSPTNPNNFPDMVEAILAENVGNRLTNELARGIHTSVLQALKFCAEQPKPQAAIEDLAAQDKEVPDALV